MSMESKLHIYNRMMATRDELKVSEVEELGGQIQRRALGMEEIRTALRVGLYAAFKNEVRTEQIFVEGDRHRKEIYFPAFDPEIGKLAYFRVMQLTDLLPTSEGFREPSSKQSKLRDINTLNVLVVPGVAFDIEGRRMGFGKGFYDECLRRFRGKRVALAYEFQVVSQLPTAVRERVLDWIVTEKRVIRCQ
ncbi:MAG: 5-formyltetrahydrofolate cyclo-ligase [bacterium]